MSFFTFLFGKRESKPLGTKELNSLSKEIEDTYKEYAKKYGTLNFSMNNYKERYIAYLKTKNDLNLFYQSELKFLKERKAYFDSKIKNKVKASEISNKMDQMMDEIVEKTKNYPEEFIDERANIEMRRLVGACKYLYPELTGLRFIVSMNDYNTLLHDLVYIEDIVEEPYGGNYKNYVENIRNYLVPISKAEVYAQKTQKDVGVALHQILEIIKKVEPKLQPTHVMSYIENMIKDFRLEIFGLNNTKTTDKASSLPPHVYKERRVSPAAASSHYDSRHNRRKPSVED